MTPRQVYCTPRIENAIDEYLRTRGGGSRSGAIRAMLQIAADVIEFKIPGPEEVEESQSEIPDAEIPQGTFNAHGLTSKQYGVVLRLGLPLGTIEHLLSPTPDARALFVILRSLIDQNDEVLAGTEARCAKLLEAQARRVTAALVAR